MMDLQSTSINIQPLGFLDAETFPAPYGWGAGSSNLGNGNALHGGDLPHGNPLLFIPAGMTDNIGLSVDDYDSLTTDQQAFFFVDPATPDTWADFTSFWAAVSVQSWFNSENVMGTEAKGVAIYHKDSSSYQLNKGYSWFGLPLLTPEFGPTWNDNETWDDNAIWTE